MAPRTLSMLVSLLLLSAATAIGEPPRPNTGEVSITVARFEELLAAARVKPPVEPDEPPPIEASLEGLMVQARIRGEHAEIVVDVTVRSLSKNWVAIPILCQETTVASVKLDGKPATLGQEGGRYVLHLEKPGEHELRIEYSTPVEKLVGGHRIQFCVPRAVSGKISTLPVGTCTRRIASSVSFSVVSYPTQPSPRETAFA